MPDVFMPRLSDTMTEGTVSTWTKSVGDHVEKGDVIAEIETDKATMELEAYDAGVLEQIVVGVGTTVPIGQVIAVIGDGAGAQPAPVAAPKAVAGAPAAPAVSAAVSAPAAAAVSAAPTVIAAPAVSAAEHNGTGNGVVKASPLARAIARDAGIDLSSVAGSGPGGRIVRADVKDAVAALANGPTAEPHPARSTGAAVPSGATAPSGATVPPSAVPASTTHTGPDVEEVPLSNVRKITARRLVESMQQAPHFYVTRVIDADELVATRARINDGLAAIAGSQGSESGAAPVKVSINDLVVKAVATALRAHPEVNVSYAGDTLRRFRRVHIGVAVAIPNGLIVPVIRDADTLTIRQISAQTRDLASRARAGKLTPEEFTGSTFSISNLGMFGVDQFTAVINPPEAAILAVGATKQEPVVRDGQIVVGHTMRVTLSVDHRALDGATAAIFLADLTALLENPIASMA